MAQSAISLCSKAMIKLGASPVVSFYENTTEAQVASQLYSSVRDGLLSSYPWRFATCQVKLPRLQDAPVADFAYAYQLPNDFLRALSAGDTRRAQGLNYRVCERTLQTNAPSVVLTYIFRPKEENFPAFFDDLLVAKLAAEFSLPLTENVSRTQLLYKLAQELFAQAKLIDAQQSVTSAIEDFSLIGVRL